MSTTIAQVSVQVIGGVTVLGAGVALLVLGHPAEGIALSVAGATELGVKGVLL